MMRWIDYSSVPRFVCSPRISKWVTILTYFQRKIVWQKIERKMYCSAYCILGKWVRIVTHVYGRNLPGLPKLQRYKYLQAFHGDRWVFMDAFNHDSTFNIQQISLLPHLIWLARLAIAIGSQDDMQITNLPGTERRIYSMKTLFTLSGLWLAA